MNNKFETENSVDAMISERLRSQKTTAPKNSVNNWQAVASAISQDSISWGEVLFRLTPVLGYYAFVFFLIGAYAPSPSSLNTVVEGQIIESYLEAFESSSELTFEDDILFY